MRSGRVAWSTVVLILLLIAAAGVFLFDRRARAEAEEAFETLQRLPRSDDLQVRGASPLKVQQLLGKEPQSKPIDDETLLHEVYAWRSVVRTYTVYIVYQKSIGTDFEMAWLGLNDVPASDDIE